jgi:hypothetical protein
MGKVHRERLARIRAGLEVPIHVEAARLMWCRNCGEQQIPLYQARNHIRKCWGYDIKDDEPIPDIPRGPLVTIWNKRDEGG